MESRPPATADDGQVCIPREASQANETLFPRPHVAKGAGALSHSLVLDPIETRQ